MAALWTFFARLFRRKRDISVSHVSGSTINIIEEQTIIERSPLAITEEWFLKNIDTYYDEEIKHKYIPVLHHSSEFERKNLGVILHVEEWKQAQTDLIKTGQEALSGFVSCFPLYHRIISQQVEDPINPNSSLVAWVLMLNGNSDAYESFLEQVLTAFSQRENIFLKFVDELTVPNFEIDKLDFHYDQWSSYLYEDRDTSIDLKKTYDLYNDFVESFQYLLSLIDAVKKNGNYKIIAGNAGAGKTHLSAHIISELLKKGGLTLFLKSKLFNGNEVNFDERFLELLNVPKNYTLNECLEQLNAFAQLKGRRCFIIIDALNETTKSDNGFSDVWRINLQRFANTLRQFPGLYLINTLRTSYIAQIWDVKPVQLRYITGLGDLKDIKETVTKYLHYYKINALNFEQADLAYFNTPLLLDLYCKMINEDRKREIEVTLNIKTYVSVFEDYINNLISEVKSKLKLQKTKPIEEGLDRCATAFWLNNEAEIPVNDFSDAFDPDDRISQDNSIAYAVLEGYLIFIRDFVARNKEIVKHTQQEVGGYLLAKELLRQYPIREDMMQSVLFAEKILGDDHSKHHQLRLDILKFLIALDPELITQLDGTESHSLSWWFVYNGTDEFVSDKITQHLFANTTKIQLVFEQSRNQWVNATHAANFNLVERYLKSLDMWTYNLEWVRFLYFQSDHLIIMIRETTKLLEQGADNSILLLRTKLISYLLSTTVTTVRDLATRYILSFGKKHPNELTKIALAALRFGDSYRYERLIACCYGVALNLQHDERYLRHHLPFIARALYDSQFGKSPKDAVYNYIVIDSIKHLADLAILKGSLTLTTPEVEALNNYQFNPPAEWVPPTRKQTYEVNRSRETDWPAPIGMDFGIYTIPRLIDTDVITQRKAIANVYKRIQELGYRSLDFSDDTFRDEYRPFFQGERYRRYSGKFERLGKKYSWAALYDYAGFLLLNKQLNCFEENPDGSVYYSRLSDVRIDYSFPLTNYGLTYQLYQENLLSGKDYYSDWYKETKIDSMSPYFTHKFEDDEYTMLYGKVDQNPGKDYKIRSFILAESFFIKRDDRIDALKQIFADKTFDWDLDIHFPLDKIRHTYFGEMYWSDSTPKGRQENVYIPTGDNVLVKRKLTIHDIFREIAKQEDIGKTIEEARPERWVFEAEATTAEFLWESDSDIWEGIHDYFPGISMAKQLHLQVEPGNTSILDAGLKSCYHCLHYEDDEKKIRNDFNYIRTDLIRQYMVENDLAIVYQVKQHAYDLDNHHNRQMKFFILEQNDL